MAQKKTDNTEYEALKTAIKNEQLGKLYIFYGEERYLLENSLVQIRKLLAGDGFGEFNYKRFGGPGITIDALAAACDMLPAFAERTLVEVNDFDIYKLNEESKEKLMALLAELPDYVCLIFVYDVVEYNPDGRQKKLTALLKKDAHIVEFGVQEQSQLIKWIKKHFADWGKKIDTPTAEYLAAVTGGLMTALNVEIDKVASSTEEETISRGHIDTVVTPVLDAVAYELTDHIAGNDFNAAAAVLVDLLSMREVPHKIMYSITLKLRQLLAARLCYENGLGEKALMSMCDIRLEFLARNLMTCARKTTLEDCRKAVILSAETAFKMNSGSELESALTELLISLAENTRRNRSC